MNEKYWKRFYATKDESLNTYSSFARYIHPYIKGAMIELGCGNGRDTKFFKRTLVTPVVGIDKVNDIDVTDYIKTGACKFDYVYTRFFWHSISRQLQMSILKWTKNYIFIEARTTEDEDKHKEFPTHSRNYVRVATLVKDLKDTGFEIIELKEGIGFSPFKEEDPHLVRIVARKSRE